MAGERSDRNAPKATADQPPVEGEPAYEPRDDRLAPEHEEPLDGPEPEPRAAPSTDAAGDTRAGDGR